MSTLPAITEALCRRLAERDVEGARAIALQAAAKMGAPRGERITQYFERYKAMQPLTLSGKSRWWAKVTEARSPWVPEKTKAQVEEWLTEVEHADELLIHGERVMPLLLTGETRCGKTSTICEVARRRGVEVFRISLAQTAGSHLGETGQFITLAMNEAKNAGAGLFLIDEIDALVQKRAAESSADKELARGVAVLLTELESLPPTMLLAATTNLETVMDSAALARFRVARFPSWEELEGGERDAFARSHGMDGYGMSQSYAEVVQAARRERVKRIIENAKAEAEPRQASLI